MIGAKSLNTHLPNTRSVLLFCMTIAAGMLAIPAISFPAYWFLAPLSLGLFFFALWRLSSLARAFWHSFIFGLFTGGSGIWWFWDTLPLDWLGLSHGPNEYYFVFASWGPVTLAFAFATAVFCIPVVFLCNASLPIAVFCMPVVLFVNALKHMPVMFDVVVNGDVKGTIYVPGRDPSYIVTVGDYTDSIEFISRNGTSIISRILVVAE